jgi:S1-C subfamily serine protease
MGRRRAVDGGRVRRGWLRTAGQNRSDRSLARRLTHSIGVEVTGFDERGPASRSALRPGDIVVGLDERPVTSVDDIHRALKTWPIEGRLNLRVIRERNMVAVDVVPVEAPV